MPPKRQHVRMARVKIESIVEHLDYDMKRALEDAISNVIPNIQVDRSALYHEFRRAVGRKCSTWVDVPDRDVEKKCRHCQEKA
jgi:hypothetical protein